MSTAAILLVGNELLSGKVADENLHFLTGELFSLGIEVRRVVVVPDEHGEVAEALLDLLRRVDVVITSGGIGPTHDDVTVAAVAWALGRPLEIVPDLVERARRIFGDTLNQAHLKMATVPRDSTLVESDQLRWPALVVDRVLVLAGIPKILRRSFAAIKGRGLLPSGPVRRVSTLFVRTDEWTLAPFLDETVASFPEVQIGSYPELNRPDYRVRITLEATDQEHVEAALRFLLDRVPADDVVRTERSH